MATKLVVTVFNHLDHLRVAMRDFFDDRGPATVRLPSPRGLVSECRDRWLIVTVQQHPLIPELVKPLRSYHVIEVTCSPFFCSFQEICHQVGTLETLRVV